MLGAKGRRRLARFKAWPRREELTQGELGEAGHGLGWEQEMARQRSSPLF